MIVPFFIAKRYLIAKKTTNFINIISSVSFVGIAVATAALVIILSVFNGLENLVSTLFSKFDPPLKITAIQGKTFAPTAIQLAQIKAIDQVVVVAQTLQETALFKYGNNQTIAKIKGIDNDFVALTHIDSCLTYGDFALQTPDSTPLAVLGSGLAYNLAVSPTDYTQILEIYTPNRTKKIDLSNPSTAFGRVVIQPVGFFNVQPEINAQYMLAPLWFVQDLLHYDHQISALEIGTAPQAKLPQITAQIRRILGNNYDIKDRYEQQDAVYKIFKIEKWAAFFILTFIVLISALNLVGLLTMLVIDKKNDIHILRAMGATKPMVRQIFIVEGLMITLTGAILGVGVGVAACWAQQKFGLITFETNGSFIVDFYPVQVQWLDIVAVFAMVLGVGLVCSIYPAKQAA